MNAKFILKSDNKAVVLFDDGQMITLILTSENCEATHIRVTGDSSLLLKPSASNQVRVFLD